MPINHPNPLSETFFRESFVPVALVSLACHILFVFCLMQLAKTFYKSKEFDRPQTFTLIKLSAMFDALAQAQKPQLSQAVAPKLRTMAPAPTASQPRQEVPVPDQSPVPAANKETTAPLQEAASGQQATGAATGTQASAATPVDPNTIYEEGATDEPAKVEKRPEPFYPEFVQEQGIQGIVRAQVVIDKDGTVSDITILTSPHELLSDEFTKALTRYKFKPAKVKGVAVRQKGIIEFEFRL
jgi:TonB family protein